MPIKIICWNIQKIGSGKLNKQITSISRNVGQGNTVLDYIVNFVSGSGVWNGGVATDPVDVFVIIEMMSNRQGKGQLATGSALRTQTRLINAMNTEINTRGLQGQYNYAGVVQRNISPGECVGVIYNTVKLNLTNAQALRNNLNGWLGPRTPFLARFTTVAIPNTPINIIGIHAPTTGGNDHYADPLNYTEDLADIPEIIQQLETVLIMGDYNCSTCAYRTVQQTVNGKRQRIQAHGFQTLVNNLNYLTETPYPIFQNQPPANIYSSVRKKTNNSYNPPFNYMSEAYDTVLYNLVPAQMAATVEGVNDLVANSQNTLGPIMQGTTQVNNGPIYPAYTGTLVKQYNKISDHFPVTIIIQ
jgi:hypothetical protein